MVIAKVTFTTSLPSYLVRDQLYVHTVAPKVSITFHIPRSRYPESYESTADGVYRIEFIIPKEDDLPPTLLDADYIKKNLGCFIRAYTLK